MNNLSDIFDRHKKSVVDFIDGVSLAMYLQGKSDAIDEVEEAIEEHLFNSPLMNPFMTRNEILLLLEQLKEQKQ